MSPILCMLPVVVDCPYLNTFCFSFVKDVFSLNGRTQVTWCMLMVKGTHQGAVQGPGAVLRGEAHDAQSEVWPSNKFLLSVIGHLGW